jgi:hypothetical protein
MTKWIVVLITIGAVEEDRKQEMADRNQRGLKKLARKVAGASNITVTVTAPHVYFL